MHDILVLVNEVAASICSWGSYGTSLSEKVKFLVAISCQRVSQDQSVKRVLVHWVDVSVHVQLDLQLVNHCLAGDTRD